MKILKKIIALAIVLGMFGQTGMNSFAGGDLRLEAISVTGNSKIVDRIDSIISNLSSEKAIVLSEKISEYRINRNISIGTKLDIILKYLELKIEEKISGTMVEVEETLYSEYSNELSISDNKKVNDELVKIQKNILNQGVNTFETILGELEKYTNYEEKGNFSVKLDVDHKAFGNGSGEFKLTDYIVKSSGFDTQLKTKLEAIIEASPEGQEKVKFEISAFMDYILKDQNYYLLLENLKIVDNDGVEEIKSYVEKAKEIASENKYIHFEGKESQQIVSMIQQFTPENILSEGSKIASKPLFTAYKKEGNKYYLVPSKFGCDTAKELANKFDPFNGSTCTGGQYQDLLEDISDSKVEFYIDFSNSNTKIGFEADNIDNEIEKFNGDISFSDDYIEEINFEIMPTQSKYPFEGGSINYDRNNFLNAYLYADKGEVDFKLQSSLDKYNNFSSIDFTGKADDKFTADLKLNNKKITGKYNFEGYGDKNVGIISGTTNYKNELSTLKVSNQYVSSSSKNNTVFEYNNGMMSLENNFFSEGYKADFKISGTIKDSTLTEGEFLFNAEQKEYNYNSDSYEGSYIGDFKKIVDSNITLKNRVITGSTEIFDKDEELLKITHTGRIEKDVFEFNNKINLGEMLSSQFMSSFDYTNTYENIESVSMDLNLKADTKNTNNDYNIYFDINLNSDKVIEFEMDNQSNRVYKENVKILAPLPNNTIELEEVLENNILY